MVHRPKYLRSISPFGSEKNLVVSKMLADTCVITSEFWNVTPKMDLKIDEVVIAKKGYVWKTRWELDKQYLVRSVYTEQGVLLGTCWDVTSPVCLDERNFGCYDWYLDVWVPSGGTPRMLGEEMLQASLDLGYISFSESDSARWTAFRMRELVRG